ncbi:MAG: metal ABC transporter permease [Halanaerobiaceae bacterium]
MQNIGALKPWYEGLERGMIMLDAFFNYTFIRNAVYGAVLASLVCGFIGTLVIEKKLVMMSGGIAHASFGGVGLGYLAGFEPLLGALGFSLVFSLLVAGIRRRSSTGSSTLVGIFWSTGMALGVLFISLTPGYPPDISTYLFGDILTVVVMDLWLMLAAALLIIFIISAFFDYWKVYLFDEEFLCVRGISTAFLEYLLFALIGLTVVVLIRVVGIILALALLTVPPTVSRLFFHRLKWIMVGAVIIGTVVSLLGLWISYQFEIASGAAIVLLAAVVYFGAEAGNYLFGRVASG